MKEKEVTLTTLGVKPALEQQIEIVDPEGSCKTANRKQIKINLHKELSVLTKSELIYRIQDFNTDGIRNIWNYPKDRLLQILTDLETEWKVSQSQNNVIEIDPEGSCKTLNSKPIKINWHRDLSLLTKIEIFSPYERKYTTFDLKYGFQYSRTNYGALLGKLQNKFRIWEASQ